MPFATALRGSTVRAVAQCEPDAAIVLELTSHPLSAGGTCKLRDVTTSRTGKRTWRLRGCESLLPSCWKLVWGYEKFAHVHYAPLAYAPTPRLNETNMT